MKKEMICIMCPLSCHLNVETTQDEIRVSGNNCPRGAKYGKDEMTYPTRMVTSTVAISHAHHARLPVITSQPVPKEKINEVMQQISQVHVKAPVHIYDVLVKNIAHSGADLLASRTLEVKEK